VAEAYLEYLYSDEGQEIAAKNYYRPRKEEIKQKYASQFAEVELFTIDEVFGGWIKRKRNILMTAVSLTKYMRRK